MTGPGGVSSKNIHETRGEVAAPSGGPGLDGPRYDALNGQFNMSVLIVSPVVLSTPWSISSPWSLGYVHGGTHHHLPNTRRSTSTNQASNGLQCRHALCILRVLDSAR